MANQIKAHKLIRQTIVRDYPIMISYTTEPYADTLTPIIYAMKDWGLKHLFEEKVYPFLA
ncbi:hypothetical protein GCM10028774_41580 [Spirosoma jeollabukense]